MAAVRPRKSKAAEPAPAKKAKPVKDIVLRPRISEKGYALSESANTYIFEIPSNANKFDVSSAVGSQFDVTVTGVRVAAIPGKSIRSYRQRGRKSIAAKRSDIRKAYVTLKDGDKLPIYAAIEEPSKPEKDTK